MNTIAFNIPAEDINEFKTTAITLNADDVANLYHYKVKASKELTDTKKKLADTETNKKYATEAKERAEAELQQGHALLSALGIADKTTEEETYYRKPLTLVTRIALYLAK